MSNAKKKSSAAKKSTSSPNKPAATKRKKAQASAKKKSAIKKKAPSAPSSASTGSGSKKTSSKKVSTVSKASPVRRKGEKCYWLMKSEPGAYSITDLERDGQEEWDGVRNYQARNFMRDQMAVGDEVLFYHSNANPSGVAGRARVSREAAPDVTALDPESKYFDAKATQEEPRWYCVEVEHVETFPRVIPLSELKQTKGLEEMEVAKRGQRLSIMPVTKKEFDLVCRLAQKSVTD